MRVPTLTLLLACGHLLHSPTGLAASPQTDSDAVDDDDDYSSYAVVNTDPLYRPGLCPPLVQPPARILPTWAEMERAEARPAAMVSANSEPTDLSAENGIVESDAADKTAEPEAASRPPATPRDPPVQAEADRMKLQREGVSRLEGNVWLQQGEHFLSTNELQFDEATGVVETLAPARFGSRQMIVDAEHARYDTQLGQGEFSDAEFYLLKRNARGEADLLARTGETSARLEGVTYTSCPPEDEDWSLKASSMELDQEKGFGTARNVRIAFMGVPFFYNPWLSFPIDEQPNTGFLFPEFGDSGRTGPWLKLPYYLNLDPQYDATLTPYYMTDRGTMLESEFRYLFPWGAGTVGADILPEDRQTGTERHYYRFGHGSRLPAGWIAGISYRQVSDEEYFQDFSTSGNATLISHLSQHAAVQKNTLEWGAGVTLQRYQTVDPTIPEGSRPYEIWPRLNYYYTPLPVYDRLWLSLEGTSTNFQRDDRLAGWRHHSVTAISTDFGTPGLYATPRVAWWQTEYDMEQVDGSPLEISRGLPVASLDTLARFERPLASGGRQSLEPRLFYLHVPYREQSDIPRFETRATTDTLASLFRENRFTGPDRLGDENRVSF
ncbi:MAG: LPS assembly protein LptD, partial [Proteobacteria bacterium]|nr:LPS assembly protein LptD [Pseudomonadota bacterium]